MKTDTGGPAFPTQEMPQPENQDGRWNQEWNPLDEGATLLDYFAGQALAALPHVLEARERRYDSIKVLSADAYTVARSMIAEKRRLENE